LLTFYVTKPVEFSTFPSLLLVATLYRLSLNVAATRLILTGANAGHVIGSIGSYAVQGNFVIGLVVFSILVVVQYVVVTSGAQRVSEVAARFTLDSMPGQQMSIDADLNMGLIDQKTAIARREEVQKEASFYGAMDGASKFVKGDAVAGIIILLIDIIAGWIVGVWQMGMSWSDALERFTLLTIGDGIATQLPALIISVATGIIVTRSAADRELSQEVFRQLSSVPRIPLIVAGVLSALLLLPGMPKWPIAILATLALTGWWRIRRAARQALVEQAESGEIEEAALNGLAPPAPIELRLGEALGKAWDGDKALLMDRIAGLRRVQEQELGIGFPATRIVEGEHLGDDDYEIRLFGARYGMATIRADRMMAIGAADKIATLAGEPAQDPAFGLPALWVDVGDSESARAAGLTLVDPVTVVMTHLGDIIRSEVSTLLTRATVIALLDDVRGRQPGLIEEIVPNVLTISDIQRVLQNLLAEGVSIANLDLIIEHMADIARSQKDPSELTEQIRQRISYAICHRLRGKHADLAVLSLDPRIENQILARVGPAVAKGAGAVEPQLADQLLRTLAPMSEEMFKQGRAPVLLCGGEIRRHLRALTRRTIPKLSIIAVAEIPTRIQLKSFDVIRLEG
jgi:flagellar biosynthesis protein FlhA